MVITRINNNITALNATRNLNRSSSGLGRSLERLSSGLRINRAADDASGLSISERLRSQIRGLNRAIANAQDAINLVNTAEGALNETTAILQRVRELAVQAANSGGQDAASIQFAQDEIQTAIAEITRIGEQTQFSTRFLLNGDNASTVSIAGASLGASIVQGPVSSTLSSGAHFLQISQVAAATAVATAGSDGVLNSGAIISAANQAASTFGTGQLSMIVGNAQAAAARVQQSTPVTLVATGNPVATTDRLDASRFNNFNIAAADTIILSGTFRDGTSRAAPITLTVAATTANTNPLSAGSVQGLLNAIGNFFDPTVAAGGNYTGTAPGANAQATAALNASGQIVVTDATAVSSLTSLTLTIARGGVVQVQESLNVTVQGNPNQATVSLDGGPAQLVTAGNTFTLRGQDPPPGDLNSPIPTLTMQFGATSAFTFTNGTDTIITTAGRYRAILDGGQAVEFQNGERNVRLFTGTGGGQFQANEEILLNFGSTVTAGTTVLNAVSNALSFQIGANAEQNVLIQIGDLRSNNLGFVGDYALNGQLFDSVGNRVTSTTQGAIERTVANLNVTTVAGANEAIRIVDQAISQVSAQRSALGAFTNRLESTVNNLGVASENLATSESRIRDADIAFETTVFTRNQILVAAGTSILAQANLAPQSVLQLLG